MTAAVTLWVATTEGIEDGERLSDFEELGSDIAEKLVRTKGLPTNWENAGNPTSIGLADEPRTLNRDKVLAFLRLMNGSNSIAYGDCAGLSNYSCHKHLLGLGAYEFSFRLEDVNGTIVKLNQTNCTAGILPADELEKITMTRTAMFENNITRMKLTLWYNRSGVI